MLTYGYFGACGLFPWQMALTENTCLQENLIREDSVLDISIIIY